MFKMKFFKTIYYYLRFFKQKKTIKSIFKKNNHSKISKIKFLSFNGRTISFSITEKKTKKKFFIKKFFFLNKEKFNYKIEEVVDKKNKFVSILFFNNLISYKSIEVVNNKNIFLRKFINGVNLSQKIKTLNLDEINIFFEKLIDYILKVFLVMKKNKFFVNIDLKPDNLIIEKNGNINLIDLDLVYTDLSEKNFEAFLLSKFFFKTSFILETNLQKILFDIIKKKINFFYDFKKILLNRFFSADNNIFFNKFIFENYNYFENYVISFDKNTNIKKKFIETISSLPNDIYIIARRYNWLIENKEFDSKDIDIICNKNSIEKIINTFDDNGWDVENNKISQFFEHEQLLVNIDLQTNNLSKFKLSFKELYENSENYNGMTLISEHHYHFIMINNFLRFKKFIKFDYYQELIKYSINNDTYSEYLSFFSNKSYKYHNKIYYSKYELIKRYFIDFLKQKDFVFIGADGAGKSTIVNILDKNISLYVNTKKSYFSSFFYPSGRTNMFFFKTSFIFLILIKIKNNFLYKNKIKSYTSNYRKDTNGFSSMRSIKKLKNIYFQTALFFLIPILVLDAWIHKMIYRFNSYRANICDRYYDDILINFTNIYVRKYLKYLIPSSRNKFYLYSSPEEHFIRKKNEDIETITHMQNCYTENNKNLKSFPTNINQSLITKKIIKTVIKSL